MSRNSSGLTIFTVFTDARAKDGCAYQRNPATDRVNNGGTCEVVKRGSEQIHHERTFFAVHQPAAAPGPVTGNRIDQYADEDGVNQIHGEFGTFGHGS